jgi:calcineurin-like phosphoesterase family protein
MWFTADEHYHHANIIGYCNRPFDTVHEMDKTLIQNHNTVVSRTDTTYHLGDFIMGTENDAKRIISKLNGNHVFIRGSHDRWLMPTHPRFLELYLNGDDAHYISGTDIPNMITLCHYAMRTWGKSHYGSIQLFGHSHGRLNPLGRQLDVGVDCWSFYPVSLAKVIEILSQYDTFNPELNCFGKLEPL